MDFRVAYYPCDLASYQVCVRLVDGIILNAKRKKFT